MYCITSQQKGGAGDAIDLALPNRRVWVQDYTCRPTCDSKAFGDIIIVHVHVHIDMPAPLPVPLVLEDVRQRRLSLEAGSWLLGVRIGQRPWTTEDCPVDAAWEPGTAALGATSIHSQVCMGKPIHVQVFAYIPTLYSN